MQADLDSLVGRTLAGRYRVVRPIGRGGMGAVFEAVQVDLDRRVALKVLLDAEPRAVARFRQEALATAKVRSPNIVTVSELVETPDAPPFLVMELLDGEPLGRLLAREKKLAPERAVGIAVQVLAALAAAHAEGIVHRDIKPSNIFLVKSASGGDVVKVLDFGVAKVLEGGIKTTTGAILGTLSYLAPEQILGRWPVGPAADLHAVGLVLHEMIAGSRPFDAKDVAAAIAFEAPRPLEGAPPSIAEAVARALAKDPSKRFPSAEAMIAALGGTARAARPLPPPANRRPIALFAAAFGVTAVVVVAAIVAVAARARPVAAPPDVVLAAPPPPPPSATESADDAPSVDSGPPAIDAGVDAARPPSAPLLDAQCLCGVRRSGTFKLAVCPTPQPPRCTCEGSLEQGALCPDVYKRMPDGSFECPGGFERPAPGKKNGDLCAGFLRPRGEELGTGSGLLKCNVCYSPREVDAIHGAECRGFGRDGAMNVGTWDCLVRRR